MPQILLLAAFVIFIVAAVIAWPAHVWVLLLVGLACWVGSQLVPFVPRG